MEGKVFCVFFARWLNIFIKCTYKCDLKERQLDGLEFPLTWDSFSNVAIFPLKQLESKAALHQDVEQSVPPSSQYGVHSIFSNIRSERISTCKT